MTKYTYACHRRQFAMNKGLLVNSLSLTFLQNDKNKQLTCNDSAYWQFLQGPLSLFPFHAVLGPELIGANLPQHFLDSIGQVCPSQGAESFHLFTKVHK